MTASLSLVRPLRPTTAADVVGGLRNIAAQIERGEVKPESVVVIIPVHDTGLSIWALGQYDGFRTIGVLHRAAHSLNKSMDT